MDLTQHDQRHRQVVEQPQPAVEVDGNLQPPPRPAPRSDPSARNRTRQGWHRAATESRDRRPSSPSRARADRSRCSGAAGASCTARQGSHSRGRPPAAARWPRPARCCARCERAASRQTSRARQRDPERVVGLGPHGRGLTLASGIGMPAPRPFALRPAPASAHPIAAALSPAAEREPPHLLVQVGPFDRVAVLAKLLEACREAGGGPPAIARIPVKPTDLPVEARDARACSPARSNSSAHRSHSE